MFKEILDIKCDMDLDYVLYFKDYIEDGFNLDNEHALKYLVSLEIDNL